MQNLIFFFKHAECVVYNMIRAGAAGEDVKDRRSFSMQTNFIRCCIRICVSGSELRQQPGVMRAEISAGNFSSSWGSFSQTVGMLKGPLAFLPG